MIPVRPVRPARPVIDRVQGRDRRDSGSPGGQVRLHIERLVLEGLPIASHQAPLVQAAIEAELAGLVAAAGIAPGLIGAGSLPARRANTIRLGPAPDPATVGVQVARAVFGVLQPVAAGPPRPPRPPRASVTDMTRPTPLLRGGMPR